MSQNTEGQVSSVDRVAFYHLWLLRQMVPYLTPQDLAIVTHAMHYCNSLFIGLPLNLTQKLQLVQNMIACILSVIICVDVLHPCWANCTGCQHYGRCVEGVRFIG